MQHQDIPLQTARWLAPGVIALWICVTPLQAVELVNDSGCNNLANWQHSNWGQWFSYVDAGDSIFSWGWWGDQSLWQDTGQVFLSNALYEMTVVARRGTLEDVGVRLELYEIDDGNWSLAASHSADFQLTSAGEGTPWETFSFSFDTSTNPNAVGKGVGIALVNRNEGLNAWIHVDSISLRTNESLTIDLGNAQQTLAYWGTSLSWWANGIGDWNNTAKFDQLMDLVFDPSTGLGFNFVRYHIGGGEDPDSGVWFRPGAKVPGFEPSPGVWNVNADPHQRRVLFEGIAHGVERVDGFSCSPPWWMTISGSTTGAQDGGNNLQPGMYDDFAEYLAEVTRIYRDVYGVTFQMLSPLNEPEASWWTYGGWQEGCHFDRALQNQLIKACGAALAAKGLSTRISAPEEFSIDAAISSVNALDAQALAYVAQLNTHGYGGTQRTQLANLGDALGLPVFMSEYGDGTTSNFEAMLVQAQQMCRDINIMQAECWTAWAVISAASIGEAAERWCMILANFDGAEQYTIHPKYYGFRQFSANIRPGSVIINPGAGHEDDLLIGLHPGTGRLSIVAVNPGSTATPLQLDLSSLPYPIALAPRIRTSATEHYAVLPALSLSNNLLSDTLPAKSITTYNLQALSNPLQRWRAPLAAEEWSSTGAEMSETSLGSGVHLRPVTLSAPATAPQSWRIEHLLLEQLTHPAVSIDAWYLSPTSTDLTLVFDENVYGDGWLPDGAVLYQTPAYVADDYVIVGTFQSEIGDANDWDAASSQTTMRDDAQCGDAIAGDGIYTLRLTIPTTGSYQMIALADRDWSQRVTAIGPIMDPHHSFEFDVAAPGQTVSFHCDINRNRIKATPRVSGNWSGLISAASQGPGVLPEGSSPAASQELLDQFDIDDDNDIDLVDVALYSRL